MKSLLFLVFAIVLSSCSQPDTDKALRLTGNTMGTHWLVTISKGENIDAKALKSDISKVLKRVNQQFSTYIPDSEVSRFNQLKSLESFNVSPEVVEVISAAQAISRQTGGAFDITVGPLVNLWGFGPDLKVDKPEPSLVATVLENMGYQQLGTSSDPPQLRKKIPNLQVDLSAIAKGYGVDELASLLDQYGIEDYLVDIGGELKVKGFNPKNELWRIAIEKPSQGQRKAQQLLQLENVAVATSGDYHNYFEENGVRYSHTIDPLTGSPITHKLASVTVLHESAMRADALATAINVLGEKKGYEFAVEKGLEVYMIVHEADNFVAKSTLKQARHVSH